MLLKIVLIYLAIVNLVAFVMYGVDKAKARANKWRIPEATLILVALIGGSIGAFAGMHIFRHKTKKPKFFILVPLFIVIHVAAAVLIFFKFVR